MSYCICQNIHIFKGLADAADELEAGRREQIERALQTLETALANEQPETRIGGPRQLQAAMTALDDATKPLAEVLMDKAMEALLRNRGAIS